MAVAIKTEWDLSEAIKIANWFITIDSNRLARAMRVGGVQEVTAEVMLALVKKQSLGIEVALSTAVCRQVEWTIWRMSKAQMKWDRSINSAKNVASEDFFVADLSRGIWEEECRVAVKIAMDQLSERSVDIVYSRLGGKTLQEIGDRWKISPERVRTIADRSIRRVALRLERLRSDIVVADQKSRRRQVLRFVFK